MVSHLQTHHDRISQSFCDVTVTLHLLAVKNHGIPQECIDNVLEANKEYFKLPTEEKLKVSIVLSPLFESLIDSVFVQLNHKIVANFKGYTPLLDANIEPGNSGDLHEAFQIGWEELEAKAHDEKRANDGAMAGANVWPERPEMYREGMLKYQ